MAPRSSILRLLCSAILVVNGFGHNDYRLEEILQLQPLPNKLVHSLFTFTTRAPTKSISDGHYQLFPKALGEIIEKYGVQELDLSLTQGNWRYSRWGIPTDGSANPSGASILALFKPTDDVDKLWKGLVNSLSGLVCASLNFVDKTVTTSPKYTFYPRGAFDVYQKFNTSLIRYANLPQENVCTENLTPWKKLLPCVGRAGLSSLLVARRLFDSHYHSMSISVRPECKTSACKSVDLKLTQTISVVLGHSRNEFSLGSLFGKSVASRCAVARKNQVIVKSPVEGSLALQLDPTPTDTQRVDDLDISTYDISTNFNVRANYKAGYTRPDLSQPPVLHLQRYLTGYGQDYGSIVCEITNTETESIQIVYTDYIPWFLRLYLHTLKIESEGASVKPAKMAYSPGLEREKPYMIELLLTLPPNATTKISFNVEKLLLRWTEYPPDAYLGFYIPSAVITAVIPDARQDTTIQLMKEGYGVVRLYTEKLLVLLPTPDFSMPYNVICLACTIVALAFGSFHNLSTKTLMRQTEPMPGPLQKVILKVKGLLGIKISSANKSEAEIDDGDKKNKEATKSPEVEESKK